MKKDTRSSRLILACAMAGVKMTALAEQLRVQRGSLYTWTRRGDPDLTANSFHHRASRAKLAKAGKEPLTGARIAAVLGCPPEALEPGGPLPVWGGARGPQAGPSKPPTQGQAVVQGHRVVWAMAEGPCIAVLVDGRWRSDGAYYVMKALGFEKFEDVEAAHGHRWTLQLEDLESEKGINAAFRLAWEVRKALSLPTDASIADVVAQVDRLAAADKAVDDLETGAEWSDQLLALVVEARHLADNLDDNDPSIARAAFTGLVKWAAKAREVG